MYRYAREILKNLNFAKYSNIKFNENPSSGGQAVHVGGRAGGQTYTTKLKVAFYNSV